MAPTRRDRLGPALRGCPVCSSDCGTAKRSVPQPRRSLAHILQGGPVAPRSSPRGEGKVRELLHRSPRLPKEGNIADRLLDPDQLLPESFEGLTEGFAELPDFRAISFCSSPIAPSPPGAVSGAPSEARLRGRPPECRHNDQPRRWGSPAGRQASAKRPCSWPCVCRLFKKV